MSEKELQKCYEDNYHFVGISSKKRQKRILQILSYCKEIRDTAYPMKDSNVTELSLDEFVARKENDIISITGKLSLKDNENIENRCFEAYILENKETNETRVYMDTTRMCVNDEPKLIRTTETIIEIDSKVSVITNYASSETSEEKTISTEFNQNYDYNPFYRRNTQISAL